MIFEEASMGTWFQATAISALALIGFISCALAQDGKRDLTGGTPAETSRPVLTGKERLGKKWTDEQRIDNCRVPVDKRGAKPRPSGCAGSPSS
jgi:hypothetical protein